jgi:uncharacterized protein YqcC (DUF446 family)
MSDHGSRIPLHFQQPNLVKATGAQINPSYESFAPHQVFTPQYKTLWSADRPTTHAMSMIRRYPDGTLDYQWAKNIIIDAIHKMQYPNSLLPTEMALISVVFPDKFKVMEPMQANILTQFSDTEKYKVRGIVEAQLKEELNYNAGRGGGSVEGRSSTLNGVG